MGKRKIQIQQLSNEKTRQLTLAKRKKGLIKKAMELAILCNADVFIQVAGEDKETTLFSSSDLKSMSEIITKDIKKSKKSLLFKEDYEKMYNSAKPSKRRKTTSLNSTTLNSISQKNQFNSEFLEQFEKNDIEDIIFQNVNSNQNVDLNVDEGIFDNKESLASTFSELSEYTIQ